MTPHRLRKSAPTEYATDEEDMRTYDVEEEEELEPDPTVKFVHKENPINYPKGYIRALTPTRFRKKTAAIAVPIEYTAIDTRPPPPLFAMVSRSMGLNCNRKKSGRNAHLHTEKISTNCLYHISTFFWPAQSPDLSPIEHIWNHLGSQVKQRTSLEELEVHLQQLWNVRFCKTSNGTCLSQCFTVSMHSC
ncbi:hypothetical protein TNCV_3721 [Trichonephila clavipes]|nr:hypothetical protein TNCV_3721 [Trichonephila clavipes]